MNETIDEAKQMIYEICKRNTPLINKDTQNTTQLNFQITDNIYGKEKIIKLTLNQLIQPNNKHLNNNNTHIKNIQSSSLLIEHVIKRYIPFTSDW
mgnify:CR=1 FL=1